MTNNIPSFFEIRHPFWFQNLHFCTLELKTDSGLPGQIISKWILGTILKQNKQTNLGNLLIFKEMFLNIYCHPLLIHKIMQRNSVNSFPQLKKTVPGDLWDQSPKAEITDFLVQGIRTQIVKSNYTLREPKNDNLSIKMVWMQSSDTQFWFSVV